MAKMKRARSDEDKLKRRETILKTAWQLYEKSGGILPTVSVIADKARLSKGAVYLYFKTKEEIYLKLYVEKLEDWVESRNVIKDTDLKPGSLTEQEFATVLTRYVRENPLILQLGSIVKGVLEENIDEDIIIETKIAIADILSIGGDTITRLFPKISHRDAVSLMLQIYAVISGLWQFASIPEHRRKALLKKGVDAFDIDFSDIVQKSVTALVKGTIALSHP